ncbi:hypothetical protein RRG08_049350 [Elysia crispata]|uniref:Uncharacterized protein n=1 Tax=Elysia crispata TaxID=231223 RepID=A0AAE0XDU9_9GAST|nr:hypothetical protein RRG08_049350 [Elysia crispata]
MSREGWRSSTVKSYSVSENDKVRTLDTGGTTDAWSVAIPLAVESPAVGDEVLETFQSIIFVGVISLISVIGIFCNIINILVFRRIGFKEYHQHPCVSENRVQRISSTSLCFGESGLKNIINILVFRRIGFKEYHQHPCVSENRV